MNLEIIARGDRAKRLLDLPEFKETLADVKMMVFDKWAMTSLTEKERLDELHQMVVGMNAFVSQLGKYVSEAKFEQERDQNAPEA